MATIPTDPPGAGSQFFITLADNLDYLDEKRHAVFGRVIEGFETLDKINDAFLDKDGRPLQDIRIRHVEILDDPFEDEEKDNEDLEGLDVPDSPTRPPDRVLAGAGVGSGPARIADDEEVGKELDEEEMEKERRRTAAASSALTLEMIGEFGGLRLSQLDHHINQGYNRGELRRGTERPKHMNSKLLVDRQLVIHQR